MRKNAKDECRDAEALFSSRPSVVRQLPSDGGIPPSSTKEGSETFKKTKKATKGEQRRKENDALLQKVRRGDILSLLAFFSHGVAGSPFRPILERKSGPRHDDRLPLRVAEARTECGEPLYSDDEWRLFGRIDAINIVTALDGETEGSRQVIVKIGQEIGLDCGRPLRPRERHLLAKMLQRAASMQGLAFTDADRDQTIAILAEAEKALALIVERNAPLVKATAKQFVGLGHELNLEDLCQIGKVGLLKAAKMFRFSVGTVLSTYAVLWIRAGIQRAIMSNADDVRRPTNSISDSSVVFRTIVYLEGRLRRPPTDEEVAAWLEITPDQVRTARHEAKTGYVSLNEKPRNRPA